MKNKYTDKHKKALTTNQSNKGNDKNAKKSKFKPLDNDTRHDYIKVLNWVYQCTVNGKTATAFDSFNRNKDTSFRSIVSNSLCGKLGLEVSREWMKNPDTGKRYKRYWLSHKDIPKTEKILGIN